MKKLKKKEEQLKVSFDLKICGVPKPFPFEIAEKVSYSFCVHISSYCPSPSQ